LKVNHTIEMKSAKFLHHKQKDIFKIADVIFYITGWRD